MAATDFGGKVNLAETTVAATVDTDDTTITVASAAAVTPTVGWPTRGLIWNRNAHPNPRDDAGAEFVVITDATGDVLTVTRAAAPATHAVGDVLVLVDCAEDWAAVYAAVNALEGNVTQGVKATDGPTFDHVHLGDGNVVGTVTITEAKDVTLGTTTGSKIGTAATQKLGFFNATPVVQPAALTAQLTGVTHSAPGTPDYAIGDPVQNSGYGFSTADEMLTLLSVVANLQTRLGEAETKLKALGLLA